MRSKYDYLKEAKARLIEHEAEINRLIAKAEAAQAEARLGQEDIMDEIRSRFDSVSDHLQDLEDSNEEPSLDELKASVERGMADLQDAVRQAAKKMK